jgi:Membrane MotB of proton-channel complex MotA/MotB
MARCKCPAHGPNMGYLVSFGDTMTALLAFFIVLNSLAEEQTGANLHSGTGSFIRALNSFGMSGTSNSDQSKLAFQMNATSPLYFVPDPEERPPERNPTGPDEDGDDGRVLDREREQFQRFLDEIKRLTPPEKERDVEGEVSFDVLGKLPAEGSPMTPEVRVTLSSVGAMLRKTDYTMQITVWATTPSQTAWTRAVRQAAELRTESIRLLNLDPGQQTRVAASGRSWISKDLKRPAVSITLRRLAAK